MAIESNDDNKFLNLTQLGNYTKEVTTLIKAAKNEGTNAALKAASAATAATNAQSTADTAKADAATAQEAAEAADTKAQTALDGANEAYNYAATVDAKAITALNTATNAMPKSGGNFTGAIKWQNGSSPDVEISYDGITATVIKKSGGTASQVLMADGSVKKVVSGSNKIDENAAANTGCIPLLDNTGKIPLSMLGNLDTTLFEVVASRPTELSKIKKHIYLVKDLTGANNQYTEWIYTGGIGSTDTYDASKWEKLGNFSANIDLAGYLTKTDASSTYLTKTAAGSYLLKTDAGNTYLTKTDASTNYQFKLDTVVFDASATTSGNLRITLHDGRSNTPAGGGYGITGEIPNATTSLAGLMSKADKAKLDGISTGANKITIDSALSSSSTNPVQNKVVYTALSGKASTAVASTTANGLMSSSDKTKLNGIAEGANKYVLPRATQDVLGGVQLGADFTDIEDHLEINKITKDDIDHLF